MLATTLTTLLLSTTDPIGCGLVVEGHNELGQNHVEHTGYGGTSLGVTGYRLTRNSKSVRTWAPARSRLSSLTWRPTGGKTATFTCTQSQVPKPTAEPRRVPVMCLVDTSVLTWGIDHVMLEHDGISFSVMARAHELRMSAESPARGFVGVWANDEVPTGNPRTLDVGRHVITCWRL